MVVISDVERKWVNLGQSEYKSSLRIPQQKQYFLLEKLNFFHSESIGGMVVTVLDLTWPTAWFKF